jgi:GTPase
MRTNEVSEPVSDIGPAGDESSDGDESGDSPKSAQDPEEAQDPDVLDPDVLDAVKSIQATLQKLRGCNSDEQTALQNDFDQLEQILDKLTNGCVEIVVFGEISTGKSALINALIGDQVASVDVQGGWTTEVGKVQWGTCEYRVPGFANSSVTLVDTPGINEVSGEDRAELAREAAKRADLILFVTDSDLNETEYAALLNLLTLSKPVLLVLNKVDLYSPDQRSRLLEVLCHDRLNDILPEGHFTTTSADPREIEYVVEAIDGSTRKEWRRPQPEVGELKEKILEILDQDGLGLVTLSAAMYTADKSDRIAATRIRMRKKKADQLIMRFAAIKAAAVALNPAGWADMVGGTAVDALMIVTLGRLYGEQISWKHAAGLAQSIIKAAGLVLLPEWIVGFGAAMFKTLTGGLGTVLTAIPQGAGAGFGSYIVGHAAQYYFEHSASWGPDGPKRVVKRILEETDKDSVIAELKAEIQRKLNKNTHANDRR